MLLKTFETGRYDINIGVRLEKLLVLV